MVKHCKIENCTNKHEARGYCKRHYKSYMKHGKAEQVDINKKDRLRKKSELVARQKEHELTVRGTIRKTFSTDGTCEVEGCDQTIKARKLCDMHYTRMRRNGKIELSRSHIDLDISICLVIGCKRDHFKKGYCSTHYSYFNKNRTPYLPKVIKLCGVKGCDKVHLARGLCNSHYKEWVDIMNANGLKW